MDTTKPLICLYSVLLIFCVSCCKENVEVTPDKTITIDKGNCQYVYSEGLQNLPKYKNQIIAHTSFLLDNWDDDRLCAINLKTGKADWYFPKDLSKAYKCAFDGFSYIYENKLVFKYIENYPLNKNATLVCLNLDTQEVIWEKQEINEIGHSHTDIFGIGRYCYFDRNKHKVCRVNLDSGEETLIYDSGEFKILHLRISTDGELYLFEDKTIEDSEDILGYYLINESVVLDKDTGDEKFRYKIKPFDNTEARWYGGNGILQDGILYANVDTYLTAVDVETGRQFWERNDPEAYILEDLIVYNGVVLKCGGNSTYGYNAQTGELLYKYDNFGSHYTTRHGKYAYMVTNAGWLAVIDIATGRIHKRIDCPDEMFFGSYPTFYGDKMYIMGLPNYLYCYSVDKMER